MLVMENPAGSYQILGGKAVKNAQIDQQTTEIWPKFKPSILPLNTVMCHETIMNIVLIKY